MAIDVYCACITPFKKDGGFDEAAYRKHLEFLTEAGVGVYVLPQGGGEGLQVPFRERLTIYEVAAKCIAGRVPVGAAGEGLGPSAREFVEQAHEVQHTGVSSIQVHAPRPAYPMSAAKPAEVEGFFRDVLDALSFDSVLSVHNGAVPGVEPRPELLRQLVDTYPHLIGVNVTVGNALYLRRIIDALKGTRAEIRVGGPQMALECLAYGGHGILGVEPNLVPKYMASLVADWKAGNTSRATQKWATLMRLTEGLSKYGVPVGVKAGMNALGLPGGFVRRPYLELDVASQADVQRVVDGLGVREWERSVA